VREILLATAAAAAFLSSAQAEQKAKTPQQACQAQALAELAKWSGAFHVGMITRVMVILKGNRCLVFLDAPAIFEGKHTIRFIDVDEGSLLSEFYGPVNSDRGLCTYQGGKFPTAQCTLKEYWEKADQM
jgi:hypothetical protein